MADVNYLALVFMGVGGVAVGMYLHRVCWNEPATIQPDIPDFVPNTDISNSHNYNIRTSLPAETLNPTSTSDAIRKRFL